MLALNNDINQLVSEHSFPIVGVGASAGGLEAFKLFIKAIPEKSGMAYVLVQHLSPAYVSTLPEILQQITKIPVRLISDNIHLEKDTIYIIPPDNMLTSIDGILKLQPIKDKKLHIIDLFFSSLAVVHQSFAVGVVLSGALSDGTLGLQVIKSYGGLTFAQEEESAAYKSMPKSAIESGAVDFILPAGEIIPKLIEINYSFHLNQTKNGIKETVYEEDEEVYKQLLAVLRIRRGVDFANYKQSTIKRRFIRRMALNKIDLPHDYLNFLRENKGEQDALYNDMLISVTNFFRDIESFDFLCNIIFPSLINTKSANDPIRIWVAGCATGEEAYSIAICLQDYLGDKTSDRKIQIFATDVSEIAITKARTGIYTIPEMDGLSSTHVQQYFDKINGSYHVNKATRDMCVFAHHNILKDPPFSRIDLVTCRNVMIYFEPILQKRAFSTFHYGLNEKGYLMLGKSETIGTNTDLFTLYNKHQKIYQSKGPHGRYQTVTTTRNEQALKDIDRDIQDKNSPKDINKVADAILLSKYTPAGVMVNQLHDVIQFRGQTDTWLALPLGKPSFNILKIAREGLSFEIRNLLHLAKTKKVTVRKEGVFFKLNEEQKYVNIEVIPLSDTQESYYLILFQNSILSSHSFSEENQARSFPQSRENINGWVHRIEQLEKELSQTREDMRTLTEDQEAVNEELQSANEELLSGSEELRSLNEELETSREELQSSNDEISIVNNELTDRNEQLNNSRSYTEEIFNTIHDPLIILDKDLKVLRATDGFYQIFKVNVEDTEGNFLYNLGNKQWDIPVLRTQLESVLPEAGSFNAFEVDHIFDIIGRRIMRLTARQFDMNANQRLTLLAIHDITDKRKVEEGLAEAERLLAESKERLHFAIESAGIGAWDFNPITKELIWDNRCRELYGLSATDTVDYAVFMNQIYPDDMIATDKSIQDTLQGANNGEFNIEYRSIGLNNNKIRWIKSKGKAYFNKDKKATRFIGTVLDISIEKSIEENTIELLRKKDEFMSIASHELKTPITSIKAVLQILERSMFKSDEEKSRYLLHKANNQVNKLTDLITDLLDVTKIQSGKLDLNKTSFSILTLVEECCEQVADNPININIEGTADLIAYADKNRIEQVLTNLINNAIKYSPDSDSVKIEIIKEKSDIKISITDFGIGIEKEKAPFIFDRFFRVEDTAKNFAGLGLGLYISAEIIKRHNGEIGLDSRLGKGSTFWFTIPSKSKSYNFQTQLN